MSTVPEIKKAFYIANQVNLTPEELDDQEKSEFFIQDQRGAVNKAIKQGIEQGLQQGIEQGIEQGLQQGIQQGIEQGVQQGIQQGIQQSKLEMARKMLNLVDDQTICQVTGLSITELEALKMSNL